MNIRVLPGDLAQMLPTILLALAVGCGAPALIYLAFNGKTNKTTEKLQTLQTLSQTPQALGHIEDFVPVVVKGYVYVPKTFLENALKTRQASPQQHATPKQTESPDTKLLIKRVGG
ncbi:MAG: hypothetical protein ACPLZY_05015, partial [Candidatus Norongarragalinales archaeon]